ncbi:tRNA (adenosine(37)-N6)-threonylcarbamoyltransferase complex dimerization subunit type 1 TsaB [Azohydromonas caseinilytica]|uniref:tRNA (Adenosine(37)-N6)-threonylcarbamoyltransferase complex dimerization subunit type 1 TsaB n=1 Tax=Azohydromonas caseinilytica TaxID=2728836 RepID=A0A848F5K7_9BURK|nr:tRNA (adenosine(37)-N6)-threonylcarbamoyltransferase complex dimerization subunit type 1 TsaB [Azohydromonas caseinilytica]NML13653.1 tRNA (adenosine(37)-N6)-threonylcarbamoyltransferase complex dimerization subunit type 1 TsaB [Azohydromonas caseinilytica]
MNARLLAVDCSTERLVLALAGPGGALTLDEAGGAESSRRVLPAALGLLRQAGLTLQALDAVAFAHGPGAFTGLRTACAVAQGLAFGAGKPVLALDSLLIVAEDARAQCDGGDGFEVGVAMDARMNELYAARYRWSGQAWQTLQAPALYAPGAWDADAPVLAGSGLDLLPAPAAAALRLPQARDRAGALLRLAQQAWARGEALDAAQALPLYLRDKVAQTTAEREAARAAAGATP